MASPLPPLVLTSPDLSPSPISSAPPLHRTRRRPQRYPTRTHRTPPSIPVRIPRRNEQAPEIAEQSRRPPSARALEMNDMYLDTKRNMLSLVEDNIRLKMEIQTIKQDFFQVLHSLRDFESAQSKRNILRPTSAVRERVRSMYAARRARIMSKRNRENIPEARPPLVPERSPVVKDTLSDIAGDYVRLKSPESERTMTTSSSGDTSVWVDSPSAMRNHMKRAQESPMQYASSDTISEVYTSRSLKDVSGISLLSQSSLREQPSSLNSDQFFHSTFSYPLHSTLLHDHGDSTLIQAESMHLDQNHNPSFSLSSYQTPLRQPSQQLCREHGIHPKIGTGPCIFQTDESTTMLSSSSGDFTDVDADMSPPQTQPDTDCDSSYLSECVDDKMSEAEEYTATYDQRHCRMRMLRRQTARPHLMTSRFPVGLSETDLVHDDTLKNLSVNATRASLPDFSGLSTLVSNANDDSSTILVMNKNSSQENSTSSTLVLGDLDVALRITSSSDSSGARPVSGATTNTDESPENASGLTVPVNSPNITDSGGSSSRPTTDSYDYVDIPKAVAAKYNLPPPRSRTPRPQRPPTVGKLPTPHDLRSHSSRSSSQSRSRSQSSSHSRGAKSLDQALLHSYRAGPASTTSRPESSQLCERHLQMDCCYCGQASDPSSSKPLQKDRKKVLAKKLKKFSNNFYRVNSTGNLHIQTLGHF